MREPFVRTFRREFGVFELVGHQSSADTRNSLSPADVSSYQVCEMTSSLVRDMGKVVEGVCVCQSGVGEGNSTVVM